MLLVDKQNVTDHKQTALASRLPLQLSGRTISEHFVIMEGQLHTSRKKDLQTELDTRRDTIFGAILLRGHKDAERKVLVLPVS